MAPVEGKRSTKTIQSGSCMWCSWWTLTWGISNLNRKLGMAANNHPALGYNNDDEPNFDVAFPVPSIPIHSSRTEDDDEAQFFLPRSWPAG